MRERYLVSRHDRPAIDEAALAVARDIDRLLTAATELGITRWADFLSPLPDSFRDGPIPELRGTARRARAAYGPKDSIRDALPAELTEPMLVDLDRLIRLLARDESNG